MTISATILLILKNWWWILLPIILFFPAKFLYLWWVRWDVWYKRRCNWILLEIKPPKEILKPFSAMENIFSVLWPIFDAPNWRERWCEGELPLGGGLWFSSEIASFGGEIHFYIRIPDFFRAHTESIIYAQYPEAEISLVEDYTKNVPQDVPNKDWDLYGEDFSLRKEDPYPIKTYSMFFEPTGERITREEKRLDPMDSLLEALAKLLPGEQYWMQIVTNPINDPLFPWITKGREMADKIARRKVVKPKSLLQEAAEVLITGKPAGAPPPKEAEIIPPEMKLTPGEREILTGIENKIKKHGYQTWIRIIYLYQKDKPHFTGNYKIARAYLSQFMTENLNSFTFWGPTRTRIHYWLRGRRLYLRKRRQFRRYIERLPSTFPKNMKGELAFPFGFAPTGPGIRGTFILNIEELATIFHFPAKVITPGVRPVEAKKGGPPPSLPVE